MNPLQLIIRWLAPYSCISCDCEGYLLCHWCRSNTPHIMSSCHYCSRLSIASQTCSDCYPAAPLSAVYKRTEYDRPATKQLLWRLKYDRAQSAATEIAAMLAPLLRHAPTDAVITHAPTAPGRIRQRGYDQAQLIARAIGRETGRTYKPLLTRLKHAEQIGAGRKLRRNQTEGIFAAKSSNDLRDRYIIVVDDVMTTGATLEAAAATLRLAGAARVDAAVFAYAPLIAGAKGPELL